VLSAYHCAEWEWRISHGSGDTVTVGARVAAHTSLGLVVLCLAAAVNLLQSASLSPLLPGIGEEFGTPDAATGQLATLGSLAGFGFSLAATPWMDRWSRRTWFRLEGSLIIAGLLISALAPSFIALVIGRILTASGASLIMANCMTGARELFPDPVRRNRAIGLIVSATTLVFILGLPVVTQIEARLGWRVAMTAIAIPAALLLAGTFVLPEKRASARAGQRQGGPFGAFRTVLENRRVGALLVVLGLLSALYSGWFVYFGAYTTGVFVVSAAVLSLLFLLAGGAQLVANNLAPILLRRFDPLRILYATMTGTAAALLLTGIVITTIPAALIAAVLILNGCGIAYIATNVLLLDSDVPHPGAVMSMAAATGSLGAALGPLITGLALANLGSFEAAYRTLGILAPLAVLTVWLGTRNEPVGIVERAAQPNSVER
jgi:predicted MFS family arabinose efflux permease